MFRIITVFLVIIGLLAQAAICGQDHSLEKISQSLGHDGVLTASFIQKKKITGLPAPLVSSGTLTVQNGKGIVWETETPFPITLLLNQHGIFQIDEGKKTNLVHGRNQDKTILNILSKVLNGNFNTITEFKVKVLEMEGDNYWKIDLLAQGAIAKFITKIQIDGNQFIRKIVIQRANKDTDEITLSQHQLTKTPAADIANLLND
ncbi:MAG: outer membrane lipoprotein carrier protein LolA [Candidatus Paracaedibacteraceae bacterium]|nr:outer membrane lipoprotein carrier protein LolA [Candidatus Paracaedibacteraceae bacterium]